MLNQLLRKGLPVLPLFSRQAALFLLGLGFGVYFARQYDLTDYALYSNLLILVAFTAAVGDGSFYIPLMAGEERRDRTDPFFTAHLLVCLGFALLIAALSHLLSRRLFIAPDVFFLLGASLLLAPIQAVNQLKFERQGRFGLNVLNEVLQALVFFVTLTLLFRSGTQSTSLGWAFVARAVSGAVLALTFARYRPRFRSGSGLRHDVMNGLRLIFINLLGFLNSVASPTILGTYFGPRDVAVVNWANSNAQYVQQPFLILNRYLLPRFSRSGAGSANSIYSLFGMVYFALLLLVFVTGPSMVQAIFGQKWTPHIPVLYGVLLTTLLVPLSVPTGAVANATGRSALILKLNLIRLGLFWGALIAFSALGWGVWSFVAAQAVAELIHLPTLVLVMGARARGILSRYLGTLGLAVLSALPAAVLVRPSGIGGGWQVAALTLVCCGLFLLACYTLMGRQLRNSFGEAV